MSVVRDVLRRAAIGVQGQLLGVAGEESLASERESSRWWEITITATRQDEIIRLGRLTGLAHARQVEEIGQRPDVRPNLRTYAPPLDSAEELVMSALSRTEPRDEARVAAATGYRAGDYLRRVLRGLFRRGLVVEHADGWLLW